MDSNTTGHGRRRFLMGAAGVAAVPLIVGVAAACTPNERTSDSLGSGAPATTRTR